MRCLRHCRSFEAYHYTKAVK